jgi:hypothetical protein
MAQCGKRRGGCNTPESLARARAQAQAAHDKWVAEYIAQQRIKKMGKSITGFSKSKNFWPIVSVSALAIIIFFVKGKPKT